MAHFIQDEQKDGARFAWNIFPTSRLDQERMAVPVSCLYTPLYPVEGMAKVEYPPIPCKMCSAVLNPYCRVDFVSKMWSCPFCLQPNHFPHEYADISAENLPAEIMPKFTTMEYVLDKKTQSSPIFLFVLDTCMQPEELAELKTTLLQCLVYLPEDCGVGLITFGKHVHVHELGFEECPKSHVIRGDKKIEAKKIQQLLGVDPRAYQDSKYNPGARFLLRREDVEYQFNSILEDLAKDAWPHKNDQRPARCSGAALNVAVSLLEATSKGHNARIVLFSGGPPTIGPGLVVSQEKKDTIRSHADIVKGRVPYYNDALKFYAELGERAAAAGHVIDIYAGAMDQTGVAEMRGATLKTGGYVVLDDAFEGDVFKGSFRRLFVTDGGEEQNLAMCFSGQIDVKCSPEVKVCGAIGTAYPLEKKSTHIAEREVGIGGTSCWAVGGCDPGYTVSFYFDVANQDTKNVKDQCYLQFTTTYKNSVGQTIQRVTTISKLFADIKTKDGFESLKLGFDQEAAAVLMARHAVYKVQSEYEYTMDILRWLDRRLIMLVKMFAEYQKENPESFRLSDEFMYYPGFMFHLRRSQFLKVFNSTPDETVFYRCFLLRENVTNSLVMIQPTLMAYSLEEGACQPVYLDVGSISPNRILLLDDFFHIVLFYGSTVHDWLTQEIWKQPDYAYLEEFFQGPQEDAKNLIESRMPAPIFVSCAQNGSQSRFLMSRLNPSITQNTVGEFSGGAPPVFTDDVSLKVFLSHLKKLAVAP
mmetsp:Transcript_26487/g.36914  ORF Transcript_26487/g.36914 Transcript_26487/m.36914 type:complete len:755 (+) Transcript_26487:138-2402(+)|eukprot:CAMPEP_0184480306 /NCGR_PEP_ID=MMETSP0113_2-20130426/1798_1 /TAXON_ID=91329 /ORGANISM="Norrisiella sphaerica, Strain BC52" /LENGTH=754 /DNA_ID=CAMNT_0026858693 /DNA_START=110 /DNA_END=2374 /DNA_ORIENTATION=-